MKTLTALILLLIVAPTFAQDKLTTKNGEIIFEASVPTFEKVRAETNQSTCVFNTKTGEISSLVLIKAFKFKLALMEEHFNQNYMESDSYPKSTFKGKIQNFNAAALTTVAKEYTIKGKLYLHGQTNDVTTKAMIRKNIDNGIEIISDFDINASDYEIEIPAVVKNKVSNKVSMKVNYQFSKPSEAF